MPDSEVLELIAQYRVIPVIAIENVDAAVPLADALIDGGLPIAEITFRTSAAAEVLAKISRERPELLLGAGTVLNTKNIDAAKSCGARFAVAPGLNPAVVQHARKVGMTFLPGVATPSDIESALALECSLLKLFPSEALGGVSMIKALIAPYKHTGVQFVPTGGVTADNLETYLKTDGVAAVGGTWLAKKDDFSAKAWDDIVARCEHAMAIVARLRG